VKYTELSVGWVDPRVGLGREWVENLFLVGWFGSWVWNGICAKKYMSCICNLCRVSTGKFVLWKLAAGASLHHLSEIFACRPNMTVMLVILWVFALLRCALEWWWWHDVHKLIFLRQASIVVHVWGFGWVWVGLGHGSIISPGSGLGWVGLDRLFGGLGRWK